MENNGYASIRMTQRNYFKGAWIGCDAQTGLGLPSWEDLARAYRIPYARLDAESGLDAAAVRCLLDRDGPALIEVPIDPDQTYYPKINSALQPDGSMRSNPLHRMSPDLPVEVEERVLVHLKTTGPSDLRRHVVISTNIRVTPRSGTRCRTLKRTRMRNVIREARYA